MTIAECVAAFNVRMREYNAQNMYLITGGVMVPISEAIVDYQYEIFEAYDQPIKYSNEFLIDTVDYLYGYGYGYAVGDGSDTYFDVLTIDGNLIGHFIAADEALYVGTYAYGFGLEQVNVTVPNDSDFPKPYFYIPMEDLWNYTEKAGEPYQDQALKMRTFANSYKVKRKLSNIFYFIDSTIQQLKSL